MEYIFLIPYIPDIAYLVMMVILLLCCCWCVYDERGKVCLCGKGCCCLCRGRNRSGSVYSVQVAPLDENMIITT